MDRLPPEQATGSARWISFLYVVGAAALLAWHAYLTLGLFGAPVALDNILDNRPILSGFHPQHQYLGHLGSQSIAHDGRFCAFDPAFQAGYPMTPVFNDSRLPQLCMLVRGGGFDPAAYKIGIAAASLLVPLLLLVAGWGAGLGGPTTLLGTICGMLLWWGPHGRQALEAGDIEILIAALAVLAHIGLLIQFHRNPSCRAWLGLALTGALGWFLQPLLVPIAFPLLLIYYISVGIRHASLTWHVALAAAELVGLGVNLFWLVDWAVFWWLRAPQPLGEMLAHRTFQTIWDAPLWGGLVERGFATLLMLSALVGCLVLNETRCRASARLFGFGALGLVVLAVLGIAWEPLGRLGTSVLLLPGLWFACLPAAYAWAWGVARIREAGAAGALILLGLSGGLVALAALDQETVAAMAGRLRAARPLEIGLSDQRETILDQLKTQTTPERRILWEDRQRSRCVSRWAALLPLWTERSFIGGLDSDTLIEHSTICLREGQLAGRPVSAWSDEALDDYCTRYNVGWIACWAPQTLERFERWPGAEKITSLSDDGYGWLFAVKAPGSFALKGRAELTQADSKRITLSGLEPEEGVVVLSLHYQRGMRATPSRVRVEEEKSGHDPVGFVRLRMAGPVARLTLTWEH